MILDKAGVGIVLAIFLISCGCEPVRPSREGEILWLIASTY
jgi:hypothetical protein